MIQREHFGIDVPIVIAPDYDDTTALVNLLKTHNEHARWLPTHAPQHGDLVIVHKPFHVGVWLDVDGGGVLHCVRGAGVVFTHNSSWQMSGFGRREYRAFSA